MMTTEELLQNDKWIAAEQFRYHEKLAMAASARRVWHFVYVIFFILCAYLVFR